MIALDDDDFFLETRAAPEAAAPAPLLAQTRSIGLKQSVVRWLPAVGSRALALAGSWDEPSNELSAWSVQVEASDEEDFAMTDGDAAPPMVLAANCVGSARHAGCVLGLSVGSIGSRLVAFTASGTGGACCYTVDVGDEDASITLQPQWSGMGAPAAGIATLGVSYSEAAGGVCAVSEEGVLALLAVESGAVTWKAQTRDAALFDVAWCAGLGASSVVTAGTTLGVWDMRARSAAPQIVLSPSPGVEAHVAAALLCVAADAQPPYRLAAGASDGSLHVWDVRASARSPADAAGGSVAGGEAIAPLRSLSQAHQSDVWGVHLGSGPHGQMLSCAGDGTLVAWSGLDLSADPAPEGRKKVAARTLVQLSLPVNSLDLSSEHGLLASASDAQVLTFLDLRASA